MGIKASATCVMNFDDSTGYLIGPENKGLECMFTFMNTARIGTGIQALDLLGRKVLLNTKGGAVREFTARVANFARKQLTDSRLRPFALELLKLTGQWNLLTVRIMLAARKDRDVVSSASYDFLMYSGYVTMAYMWARQAAVAADRLDNGGDESEAFYKAKLATAEFYYERLLPRAHAHASTMLSPSKNLMQLHADDMAFTG